MDRRQTKHLGVESLQLVRRLVAQCNSLFVCTRGQLDAFGWRLIVEIVTVTDGTLTSNAQEQLLGGLSMPLRDAPTAYLECASASKAEANRAGIFAIFPVCMAKSPKMRPSNLHQYFREGQRDESIVAEGEAICKAT